MADQTKAAGYYVYGVGDTAAVLYMDEDVPPMVYRLEEGEWVEVGATMTLYDRMMDGDVDGPYPEPPDGAPPVPA